VGALVTRSRARQRTAPGGEKAPCVPKGQKKKKKRNLWKKGYEIGGKTKQKRLKGGQKNQKGGEGRTNKIKNQPKGVFKNNPMPRGSLKKKKKKKRGDQKKRRTRRVARINCTRGKESTPPWRQRSKGLSKALLEPKQGWVFPKTGQDFDLRGLPGKQNVPVAGVVHTARTVRKSTGTTKTPPLES